MRRKTFKITAILILFMFVFSLSGIAGVVDDEIKQTSDDPKPELKTSRPIEPKVVEVSADDTTLTTKQGEHENTNLTPIETATSIASGMIASGTTDKSVVMATLVSYGYETTEAEIAYVKASINNVLDNTAKVTDPDTDETTIQQENVSPAADPGDRVKQGLKPQSKFQKGGLVRFIKAKNGKQTARQDEIDTATEMLDEGYSVGQIAQGFADNEYVSDKTAAIFKETGISSSDAYSALSGIALVKAEEQGGKLKPMAKFLKRMNSTQSLESRKSTLKQDAIKSTVEDLESAGYDVEAVLDVAVQDLKDNGMTSQQTKDFLIEKVADGTGKPGAKFKNNAIKGFLGSIVRTIQARKNGESGHKPSHGQGEISLASAMLKAGYSASEVESAFQTGDYSYTNADTHMIVSAAVKNNSEQAGTGTNNINNTNNNIQDDILHRNTQAIPI